MTYFSSGYAIRETAIAIDLNPQHEQPARDPPMSGTLGMLYPTNSYTWRNALRSKSPVRQAQTSQATPSTPPSHNDYPFDVATSPRRT